MMDGGVPDLELPGLGLAVGSISLVISPLDG